MLTKSVCKAAPQHIFDAAWQSAFPLAVTHTFRVLATYPESILTFVERYEATARRLVRAHPGQTILLVTHGIAVQTIAEMDNVTSVLKVPYCSLTLVEYRGPETDESAVIRSGARASASPWKSRFVDDASHWQSALPTSAILGL
jgi:broad specificity phosphatase PhoE